MPARSNIFQRLVAEIHRDLSGWDVQESRLLFDKDTGDLREVDIVASSSLGGYPILVCVEVRDRTRRADVTWVEQLVAKHSKLDTNKLVLWSSSGFTRQALNKATAYTVSCVGDEISANAPWARFAREAVSLTLKWMTPKFGNPVADVDVLDTGEAERWPVSANTILRYVASEGTVGHILALVNGDETARDAIMDKCLDGLSEYHAEFTDPDCIVIGDDGRIGKLRRLLIGITIDAGTSPVLTRSALYNGVVTTIAEASVSTGTVQLVVRESPALQRQVTSRLLPPDRKGESLRETEEEHNSAERKPRKPIQKRRG
jgi:hypothetical protein